MQGAYVCLCARARRAECASRKIFTSTGSGAFFIDLQVLDAPGEIGLDYDRSVSEFVQYLFNHCMHAADCWRDAQVSFTKVMRDIFVTPFESLKPDYASTTVGSLSAQGGAAVNLRDGTQFVSGGVAMVDPRGNSFKPGVTGSVGWIWGADNSTKVNDFLGGDGNQFSVSIPTATPVNVFLAVTHSYGGSTALEIGVANPGKLSGAISPISHAKKVGD